LLTGLAAGMAAPLLDSGLPRLARASEASPEERGLAAIAGEKGITFGSAMTIDELTPAYRDLFAREVRLITPGNELKLAAIRPRRGPPQYSGGDRLIDFAEENDMLARGHVLIWNEWLPDWIKKLSSARIARLLDHHVDQVCTRYRGRIHSWDVVNEPIGTDRASQNWLYPGPFLSALGEGYIDRAFRRARAADPDALLVLNETHTERGDSFGRMYRQRLLRLIDRLQQDGVPLDAIGLQGHLDLSAPFDPDGFSEFLEQIAARGLSIQITELDVDDRRLSGGAETRDRQAAERLYTYLTTALACQAVRMVVAWQLDDASHYYTWLARRDDPQGRKPLPRPALFDQEMRKKPAWFAVARAFSETAPRS
jgi:endo-1,4-beta-xylanase